MGEILVKLPNETFKVKITGDRPTVEEQLKINNMLPMKLKLLQVMI